MENHYSSNAATAYEGTGQSTVHRMSITPFLWLNGNVEEALNFYTSVFKNTKIINAIRYGDGWPGTEGKIMTATFQLEGQEFMVLDGGPQFTFTPAISFFVNCTTQQEVDELWERLSEAGETQRCGWLKDKFGISWQIIPAILGELLNDHNPEKSRRVMQAMLEMDKIDIRVLQEAYYQETVLK
jgi:predicted 3-demethylubiquinone-9 3-methyltransferase (glyoxalase superfamily)